VVFGNELWTGADTLDERLAGFFPAEFLSDPDVGEIGVSRLPDLPVFVVGGFDDHAVMLLLAAFGIRFGDLDIVAPALRAHEASDLFSVSALCHVLDNIAKHGEALFWGHALYGAEDLVVDHSVMLHRAPAARGLYIMIRRLIVNSVLTC
jgi:hypothetical protein